MRISVCTGPGVTFHNGRPWPVNAHTLPSVQIAHAVTTTSFWWSPLTSPITGDPKIGPLSTTGQPGTVWPLSR